MGTGTTSKPSPKYNSRKSEFRIPPSFKTAEGPTHDPLSRMPAIKHCMGWHGLHADMVKTGQPANWK